MASITKMIGGILLLALGIAIIYESSLRHYIELVTAFGILLFVIGACLLAISFFERNASNNRLYSPKRLGSSPKTKTLGTNLLNNKNKGPISSKSSLTSKNSLYSKGSSASKSSLTSKGSSVSKSSLASNFGDNLDNSILNPIDTKKITDKVRDVSKPKDSKAVLNPLKPKVNLNTKRFRFTPNYERPMKVTRRPKKRNRPNLNVFNPDEVNNINHPNNNQIDYTSRKSEEVVRALASDDFIRPIHSQTQSTSPIPISNNQNLVNADKETNTNLNESINPSKTDSFYDPESSKFLNSYVVCSRGTMTSKEAFQELAKSAKNKMVLEMPSIKELDDGFLSKISSLNVRMIIKEFDIKDMPYVLLLASLIEQGVKIRTLPLVTAINLVSDDSHALIISENESPEDLDIGAVYNDSKSISNIKAMFEKSWNIAMDLDLDNLK